MPANRKAPESAPFWFQSLSSPAWRLYALGCSYKGGNAVGAGHARDRAGRPNGCLLPKNRVFSHYESLNAICSANTFENRPKAVAPKEVRH